MNLFAQSPAGGGPAGTGSLASMLIPFVLMIGIFYLVLYMPMKRKQKQHQNMLNALKGGERIITAGGIYGTVTRVMDDRFEIEIGGNARIQITKSSIAAVIDIGQGDKAK